MLKMADIMNVVYVFYFILICSSLDYAHSAGLVDNVHHMQSGIRLRIESKPDQLEIFCFNGHPKHVARIWETVLLKLELRSEQYEQYDGSTPDEVAAEYELHHSSWMLNPFSWKKKDIRLEVFNQSCVGILNRGIEKRYNVELIVIHVDYWRVIMVCAGVLLYVSAPKLSNNPLFYYLCGISLGICAGFLILVYMLSKLLPKRPVMYGVLIGGWTVGLYFIQLLWENFRTVMLQYQSHVLSYTAFTGVLSFIICYRFGPVTDPRTRDLIKWTLQIVGLGLVIQSSQYLEASLAIVTVVLASYNFPAKWISKIKSYWQRRFPPKVKMLSEDQYHEEGVKETQIALAELRGYCSSPDCDAWKTVLKLKEPVRFARFMSGNSHLNDAEILAYESESRRSYGFGCDEEEDSEEEVY